MERKLHSEFWSELPWKQFRKSLFRLQKRVWKATRAGEWGRVKDLQKLILRSRSAQFLAVRQVTQLNNGRKTAGVDGKLALEFKERFELQRRLANHVLTWRHQKLRVIPIPKRDGTKRILKVPTIADRAWQCLVKFAMEPAHEATFHENSYGFRPGRCTWDAMPAIFHRLRSNQGGLNKQLLELDIEKCFDRISHSALLKRCIAPQRVKECLLRCFSAGVDPQFPAQGVPQGSIIGPLLANVALNGVEEIGAFTKTYSYPSGHAVKHTYNTCVRYADDMVFVLHPEQDPKNVLAQVEAFLRVRGLNVKASKTRCVSPTTGFDFLGWHFQVARSSAKLKVVPSRDNYKAFRRKVKAIVNCSWYGAAVKAKKLAPIVRGWRNYHKFCHMHESHFSLWFMNHRAFAVFNKQPSINRYEAAKLVKQAFPAVGYKVNGHIKVRGDKSPFDGDFLYWSKRNSKFYDGLTAKALRRQGHRCGCCQVPFDSQEKVHLHHVDGRHDNWKPGNILAIHESCHDYIHMRKAKSQQAIAGGGEDTREPDAGKLARPDLNGRGGAS